MTPQTRVTLIRDFNAEMVFIRRPFPLGLRGLTIKDGKVSPSEEEVQRMIAGYGPAVKPGDSARITGIRFRGNSVIVFEINGGPIKKQKWYQRISVGGSGGSGGGAVIEKVKDGIVVSAKPDTSAPPAPAPPAQG